GGLNVHFVPNAAPFKSVEFDALLRQAVVERVHNITLLMQQPLPRPGARAELSESEALALQSVEQLQQYVGQGRESDAPSADVRGVMFVSEYNCAWPSSSPWGNQGSEPGSYCKFELNIQLGADPAYWIFPKRGGTMAAVSLPKNTPGLLKQAAENLADQLEQYRLKAEKICLDQNVHALHREQEKENRARQALAYRKWDDEEKARVAQLPSVIDGPACPAGTHHPYPEVVNEDHKLEYAPVCAENFSTPGVHLTVVLTCEEGWNLEYNATLRFNVCTKAISKNSNPVAPRIQSPPVPTSTPVPAQVGLSPWIEGSVCPAGTHHPPPELNEEHRLEYPLVCAKQFPILKGDFGELSECEKGWEQDHPGPGFSICSKAIPRSSK
ncbi:MAG: hypothetical protein ABSE82_15145, partial [Nitrososphaerales archaeon]